MTFCLRRQKLQDIWPRPLRGVCVEWVDAQERWFSSRMAADWGKKALTIRWLLTSPALCCHHVATNITDHTQHIRKQWRGIEAETRHNSTFYYLEKLRLKSSRYMWRTSAQEWRWAVIMAVTVTEIRLFTPAAGSRGQLQVKHVPTENLFLKENKWEETLQVQLVIKLNLNRANIFLQSV